MAQKVSADSVQFSLASRRRAGMGAFGSYPVETDETISFSSEGVSVTLVKRPGPNKVSAKTLTTSEIPSKRAGKRKHYKRKWRGEEMTGNPTRAAYSHVDEEGVEHEIKVVDTRPEAWRGTRSPSHVGHILDFEIEGVYKDRFWRAV